MSLHNHSFCQENAHGCDRKTASKLYFSGSKLVSKLVKKTFILAFGTENLGFSVGRTDFCDFLKTMFFVCFFMFFLWKISQFFCFFTYFFSVGWKKYRPFQTWVFLHLEIWLSYFWRLVRACKMSLNFTHKIGISAPKVHTETLFGDRFDPNWGF